MKVFFEDDDCRISFDHRGADTTAFCFTGTGSSLGGIDAEDIQKEEFRKSLSQARSNCVYIIDKKRTWYAAQAIRDHLQRFLLQEHAAWNVARTVSIGNSMGGTGALVFCELLKADVTLSFAPQSSVSPIRAGFENRYDKYVRAMPKGGHFTDVVGVRTCGSVLVFFGSDDDIDLFHAERMLGAGYRMVVTQNCGHDVAAYLKRQGHLGPILDMALRGNAQGVEAYCNERVCVVPRAHHKTLIGLRKHICAQSRHDPQAILSVAPHLLDIAGKSAEFHNQISHALTRIGQLDMAIGYARCAISLHGERADYHLHLGRLLQRTGDAEGALDAQLRAAALQPGQA